MKKLLTMMLCTMTILSLAACSKEPAEDEVRGDQITNEAPADKEVSEENTSDEAATGSEEATGADEEVTEAGTEAESEEESFSMGKSEGLVYENAFIGLGCTLEEGWSFYTDEQIMQLNNYTAEVAGEDYEAMLENAQIIYDMFAVDSDQMNNINVNLEKIDNRVLMSVNVEDVFAQNLPMLEELFNSMGYVNMQTELITVTIGGEDFAGVSVSGEIQGLTVYQKSIGVKCNGYLATIAVTTYGEDTTDEILSNFYVVE